MEPLAACMAELVACLLQRPYSSLMVPVVSECWAAGAQSTVVQVTEGTQPFAGYGSSGSVPVPGPHSSSSEPCELLLLLAGFLGALLS